MSFAFPRPGGTPMVFDQASATMARGEIMLHEREGLPIPLGVAIDADGEPTTDATAALAGAQLPFGGAKGSSLALMVELLAGGLTGSPFAFEAAGAHAPDYQGKVHTASRQYN
jgi:LDH2 family malate/lactate/ureidoglycolate dehydrogenase